MCRRFSVILGCVSFAALASAGNINVTEPTVNDFLGKTNTVSFNITSAFAKVEVTATARSVANPAVVVTVSKEFTPDGDNEVSGSLNLNFAETQPQGAYTVTVSASEPGNTYNTVPPIPVTVDTIDPRFLNFNPIEGFFTRDALLITADFDEPNIDEWRVKVDNNDIPANTGSTSNLSVMWDVAGFADDGSHSVNISIEDLAGNTDNVNFNVTVDRVPPSSSILSPLDSLDYRPGSRIPVVIRIQDQFNNALDPRTVDVTLRDTSGTFLSRVAFISISNDNTTLVWTGRIRNVDDLPTQFIVRVEARDKAGNQAVAQEVTVDTGRGVASGNENNLRNNVGSQTVLAIGREVKAQTKSKLLTWDDLLRIFGTTKSGSRKVQR